MGLSLSTGRRWAIRARSIPKSCNGLVDQGTIVFTHDLDFGILLAHTKAERPSVIQVRTQDVSPAFLGQTIVTVLERHCALLESGALVTVDQAKSRVRILPIATAFGGGDPEHHPPSEGAG